MEAATFEVKTENHVAVLKSFITFADKRTIQDAFDAAENPSKTATNMTAQMRAATDAAVKIVVVSVDGKTENVLAELMNLPNREALEIVNRVSEVTDNKKKEPATPGI